LGPAKLHQARVLSQRRAGNGYYRIILQAPSLSRQARPGQFVMLRVSGGLDPLLARPFGIASVPSRSSIEVYYRVVGRGTTILTAVKPGSMLTVVGPVGNGFPPPGKGETPLLVAGGSGFPPLLFFAVRYGRRAHLFAGSRDRACMPPAAAMRVFRSQVAAVHFATEDGSCGTCGFVTDALAAYLDRAPADRDRKVIYACGPQPMLAAVGRLAAERSLTCLVSLEERMACGLGACMGCAVPVKAGGYRRVCREGPVFDSREIEWNNRHEEGGKAGR
jgi:dihydroorotate dehydrogenase electron transfer subunit